MGEVSEIEWTDSTWTPIRARRIHWVNGNLRPSSELIGGKLRQHVGWHCERVSEGCRNCYAEGINRRLGTRLDFKPGHRDQNGGIELFLDKKMLLQPLKWKKPRRIFVCSMTDLFADFVKDEWIDRVFAVMALCPQHRFQVLTKRAKRMREYFAGCDSLRDICDFSNPWYGMTHWYRREGVRKAIVDIGLDRQYADRLGKIQKLPLPNVWLGVSAEDQANWDERKQHLRETPAAVRFASFEPLLGPIVDENFAATIQWAIVGGESGPHARPMHPQWARNIRDQCKAASVPFFFKQWGEYFPVGQILPGFGKVHGATAVKPGRMKLHYGGTPEQKPKHAFADHGVEFTSTHDDRLTFRVGKKRAGRLLDGREWNEMPG